MLHEKHFQVPTSDGFIVFGRENWVGDEKPKKTLILCHGFGGDMNTALLYNGMHYFTRRGYHVVRLNFYCMGERTRKMQHTSLRLQAEDVKAVRAHFQNEHVFAAGHSYGGLTLLLANLDVVAQSLWDPSHGNCSFWNDAVYHKELDAYLLTMGNTYVLGKNFMETAKEFTAETCQKLAEEVVSPTQIISAGRSYLREGCQIYSNHLQCPHILEVFPSSGHNFGKKRLMHQLFETTHAWFEQF